MGEPFTKVFRAAHVAAPAVSSLFALTFVALAVLVTPNASAQKEDSDESMQLVADGANPTLRFPVAHNHGFKVCVGYLYVSREGVRYEVTGPDDSRSDSFDLRRDQIRDIHAKMSGVQLHSTVNDRNYLFALTKVSVVESKAWHLSAWNMRNAKELLKALEHFDEMLAVARERAGQNGSIVATVVSPPVTGGGSSTTVGAPNIPPLHTPEEADRVLQRRLDTLPHGIYELDTEVIFNVLDNVYFDPPSGQISLVGHRDENYHGPRIPYLQHLASLLETERPEFTLTITPDSDKRIDRLFEMALSSAGSEKIYAMVRDLYDANGMVTPTGRSLLPALGLYPIEGNRKPGYLGVQVALTPGGTLRVTAVSSGSLAAAAGIATGDELTTYSVPDPLEFLRRIRFAGAGATADLTCTCSQQTKQLHITLSADPDSDPWKYVTRYDGLSMMFRSVNNPNAAKVIDAVGLANEVRVNQPALAQPALFNLMGAMGIFSEMQEVQQATASGRISLQEGQRRVGDRMAQRLEEIFLFPRSSLVNVFEAALQRGDFSAAVAAFFTEFDVQLKPKVGEILDTLMFGPEGFQIPAELVEQQFQIHPEMTPEYRGVAPDSLLGRAMLDGDYLSKRFANRPDLKRTIPGYLTSFEFEVRHPEFFKHKDVRAHLWISVDKMVVAQSATSHTLEFRDVKMRFNIRELGPTGRDLPNQPGGYEELLTSLYEPLSREYPTLHELSEAAKLAAAARWIHMQNSSARLPREGRVAWQGPSRLPGLVYLYVFPDTQKRMHLDMMATGGVSLTPFPPENVQNPFLKDSSVVDLSGVPESKLLLVPTAYDNSELSRIMHHPIDVPDIHPAGWVAVADKGTRVLQSVSVMLRDLGGRDPEERNEIRGKLETCRQLGLRLSQAERAFNILNSENVSRARELQHLQDELRHDRDEFRMRTLEGLDQAGDDLRGALRDQSDNETVRSVLGTLSLAKDLKEASQKNTLSGKALDGLFAAINHWANEPKPGSLGPGDLRTPFRELFEKFGEAKLMVLALEQEAAFAKLEFITDYQVDRLSAGQEKDAAALSKVEGIRKQLSDEADRCFSDPRLHAISAAAPAPPSAPEPRLPAGPISPELAPPVLPSPTERQYSYRGNGFIGGTAWRVDVSRKPGSPEQAMCDLLREQAKLQRTEGLDKNYDEAVDCNHYNLVLGIASTAYIPKDLASRVWLDQLHNGNYSAEMQPLYEKIRNQRFSELACHSNGAMLCLAALENQDAKADHVVLYGPQLSRESLQMWDDLVRLGQVKSVQIFINNNDPVPSLSILFSDFISLSTRLPADADSQYAIASTAKYDRTILNVNTLAARIHETSPRLLVRTFPCDDDIWSLKCHEATRYKANIQCGAEPPARDAGSNPLPCKPEH